MTKRRDERSKRQKLDEIYLALRDHNEGLTQSELADIVGIGRWDINRYLKHGDLPGVYEENGRVFLDRLGDLVRMSFDRDEITMMHVAVRLLSRHTNLHNPHAASALRKLSDVVSRLDPDVSRSIQRTAGLADDQTLKRNDELVNTLRVLTEGRIKRRKVNVEYELDDGTLTKPYAFSPYFVEPYAPGLTTHVIGFREPPGKLMTFKIERLRNARLHLGDFEMPPDFDPTALLNDAWGIWYTNEPPVEVVLKFSPSVRRRVLETVWHRNQSDPELLEDGSVIWRCKIAEPREMLPWVRGWGADVEVLGPEGMRDALIAETRKLARLYAINPPTNDPSLARVLRCWGKTAARGQFHPALFHMLDVGHVAQVLLSDAVSPRWLNVLKRILGWTDETICYWIPFLVALHDIGKISVSFAGLNPIQKERMQREGFSFGKWTQSLDAPHGLIGQTVLGEVLSSADISLSDSMRKLIEEVIGGHHGEFARPQAIKRFRLVLHEGYETDEWAALRKTAATKLVESFLKDAPLPLSEPLNKSGAVATLTGFTILCDWLGSDSYQFVPQPDTDFEAYVLDSQRRAQQAVRAAGFIQTVTSTAPTQVHVLFPNLKPPRPLQEAIDAIPAERLAQPCLAIIEAPTGEGKTEAAMALAHRIAQAQHTDELYCALPTMATSNQMFKRMQIYLRDHLHLDAHVALIHGQAFLVEDELRIEPMDNGDGKTQREATEWFSSKKRALLAPFGVGTVDQGELAALNVRHNMLRLIGLAGKVIILDEVHAYDTYMSTIIERLLQWLSTLGTSVILLSATLPIKQRLALANAYGATQPDALPESYPSLIIANKDQPAHYQSPQAWQPNRQIHVESMHIAEADLVAEANAKARWLLNAIEAGGCACWICNTVDRAQKLFDALASLTQANDIDLTLLHARFPLDQRQQIEQALAKVYGRDGNRPIRGIVIGTQVLEQSLDLDFDVMVSDLSPVDLLLQRAGRLHRHTRTRPTLHDQPRLWVHTSLHTDAALALGSDGVIYDEFLLRQTWRALALPHRVELPRDYRPLVEAVYSSTPVKDDVLFGAWQKLIANQAKDKQEAQIRLLPAPNAEESFAAEAARLTFDEDENSAAWIVAQTRLGEKSLNIIPMERVDDRHAKVILADGEQVTVALNTEADRDTVLKLLRRNMRISNHDAIAGIRAEARTQPCRLFAESALLKGYYPLLLTDGRASFAIKNGTLTLNLHPTLGLVIEK